MASLNATLTPPRSFHPVSVAHLTLHSNILHKCEIYSYIKLPPDLFADVYELRNHASFFSFEHFGTTNLELPVFAVDSVGTALLLHVSNPHNSPELEISVPLHARYGEPQLDPAHIHNNVLLPWPQVFFICPNEDAFQHNPDFQTLTHLPDMPEPFSLSLGGAKNLQRTVILPTNVHTPSFNSVFVPVGSTQDLPWVIFGNSIVVLLMFLFVGRAVIRTAVRLNSPPPPRSKETS